MPNLEKNKQIKEKKAETIKRHKSMRCRVYTLKIKENKLNLSQKESLERYFISAKWIYNYILSNIDDIFSFNYHDYPIITHKDKDGNDVEIKVSDYLPAQFYQRIPTQIQSSIKTLSSRKKKLLENIIEIYRKSVVEYYTYIQDVDNVRKMMQDPNINHLNYLISKCKGKVS